MQEMSRRNKLFTDSVIRRMTRIAIDAGAINLAQGFPDFDPPRAILDRLAEVSREDFHQYSITWGAQNLREALAAKQSHYMGFPIDPDGEITITCGSTEAMMAAMTAVASASTTIRNIIPAPKIRFLFLGVSRTFMIRFPPLEDFQALMYHSPF